VLALETDEQAGCDGDRERQEQLVLVHDLSSIPGSLSSRI
jgi:hypothetical protein